MRQFFAFSLLFLLASGMSAQQPITLEKIWQTYDYIPNSVPGFNFQNDGRHYTRLESNQIRQYDLTTGQPTGILFDPAQVTGNADFDGQLDDYAFSADESKILIKSGTESIYRRSTRADFFVFDRKSKSLTTAFPDGKQRYATFNPQADKVAFVFENNLYVKDLANEKVIQVTTDGEMNKIINGGTDWVYEEEFSFARGFQWSPDGQRIGFYRFDESKVKEFTMTNYYDEPYPEYVTFKYPKVGQANSVVNIHIYDLPSGKTVMAATGDETDIYIPRIRWTSSSDRLCIFRMNRHQNELELLLADAGTGKTSLLLKETSKYYIDESVFDNLTFLKNGKEFVWTSERDGWHHIYLYNLNGKLIRQVTSGAWEVSQVYGIDEERRLVYYQAAERSPLERQVYNISLDGKRKQKLADAPGWNEAQFSSTFDYYVVDHSRINQPSTYIVYDREGNRVRVIEDNTDLVAKQEDAGVNPVAFFSFKTTQGVDLNGWMIQPADFQENRRYPVLMYVYGGPGSQQVVDRWKGQNYWWFQMLAQQGFVVACVDNRGTGGRGEEFKKMTYLQLGHYETIDQIEAARHLGSLPFIDENQIGIFGWSYGGYMSSLCLLKGNDVFKAAIAVAPVTNWKWYDTIYTERYMRTDGENPDGYRENSPVYFADRLKGNYLLVHGMGDDNVHFQNTAEMANALIMANKQFDTYFYPNRNHSINGGPTRLHLYTRMTTFLQNHLKRKPSIIMPPNRPVVPKNKRLLDQSRKIKQKN